MVKFVILFHTPDELENFEFAYNNFLAAVEQMPGIQRRQVNTILGSPTRQERYYRALEIYFDTYEALDAALKSETGQKAGHELASGFEPDTFETYFADVYEEAGGQTPGGD